LRTSSFSTAGHQCDENKKSKCTVAINPYEVPNHAIK
jgi:hypothetical protein